LILVMKRKAAAEQYTYSDIIDGELYDLKNNPAEWDNLYRSPRLEVLREQMTKELLNRLTQLKKR